jgi:hypothetical protein
MKDIYEPLFINMLKGLTWNGSDLFDLVTAEYTDRDEEEELAEDNPENIGVNSAASVIIKGNPSFDYIPNRETPTTVTTQAFINMGFKGAAKDISEKHRKAPRIVAEQIFYGDWTGYGIQRMRVKSIMQDELTSDTADYLFTTTLELEIEGNWKPVDYIP